jgi:membrane protein required for colicin V production
MFIDVAFCILMVLAIFKGLRKGLVLGIFSLFAFMIGLAAALKLSAVVAAYLDEKAAGITKFLPLLSFMLVFIAVVLLAGLVGRIIKKTIRFAMLGWLDSLGGIVLFAFIYSIIFSVFLFFAVKLYLIKSTTIESSIIYPYISQLGPKVIDNIGKIVPIFRDMFTELQEFFGGIAKKTA